MSVSLSPRRLFTAVRNLGLSTLAGAMLCACGGTSDEDEPATSNVSILASKSAVTAVSGAAIVSPRSLLSASNGDVLLADDASDALLQIRPTGEVFLFTSKASFLAVTGGTTLALGPMDQIREGTLATQILTHDDSSGELLRVTNLGVPSIFTTKAQVKALTGLVAATLRFPRELTNNQFIAQDTESRHIFLLSATGTPSEFVNAATFATAAGVTPALATGWTRGATTKSLFARFATTANIVRVQTTGQTTRHVSGTALAALYPEITNLRVLDIECERASDALLILVGEGTRGVGLAWMDAAGTTLLALWTPAELKTVAGDTVDVSDIAVLANGALAAVDRGGSLVLSAGSNDDPVIAARKVDLQDASGAITLDLSIATGIDASNLLLPEGTTSHQLLVR